MFVTGLLIAAFVVVHLAHLTVGWIEPTAFSASETFTRGGVEVNRHDVYAMLVAGFRSDLLVVTYVVATSVLGLHLSHGLHSLFQSLGLRSTAYATALDRVSVGFAWLIAVGFASIPIAVRLGLVGAEVT